MKSNNILKYSISITFWIGVWFLFSILVDDDILFPGPITVIRTLLLMMGDLSFWETVFSTFTRIAVGFILGFVIGVLSATMSYCSPVIRAVVGAIMGVIKATPLASIIVILLVWINSNNLSIILVLLVVTPNIYANTLKGLESVDEKLLEMALIFNMNNVKKARYIYYSNVVEYVIPAVSYSLSFSWKAGVSGEVLSLPTNSIGEEIYYSKLYLDTASLFAYTAFVIAVSAVLEKLLLSVISKSTRGVSSGRCH